MSRPDTDSLNYLESILFDLETLVDRTWLLNDDRLAHTAKGISFQVQDLLEEVQKRLNARPTNE